jgi:hypothetical protein
MKTPPFILALAALMLAGCTTMTVENPDGTKSTVRLIGTDADLIEVDVPNGRLYASGLNNSESFRRSMQTVSTVATVTSLAATTMHAATQETKQSAIAAGTDQAAIKAAAQVDTEAIKATSETAQSVGNNPEANTGALNAVGNLFRRR